MEERLREHALGLPGAWPDEPWDGDQVAKVGAVGSGKIFAFLGVTTLGVKCGRTRDEADEWLDRYPQDAAVMAYIGRSGWNTLRTDGAIPAEELVEAIDESYDLVVSRMPRRDRPAPTPR
jgi:predicted DNA-binding protein (MmcQ/YjbR family)